MVILVVIVHVVVCLFLIGVVLLQQSKSADVSAAFGGQGSQTAFGPRSAASLLTKLTAWSFVVFILTSVSLTVLLSKSGTGHSAFGAQTSQSAPAKK